MENATQALIIAFTVLVFVIALTVSMVSLNSVKRVSDTILYTKDETNYYTYTDVKGKAKENRIVGLETIIPTLYKYHKENYTVVFKKAKYNEVEGTFSQIEYLPVYTVNSDRNWQKDSYKTLMIDKYYGKGNSNASNQYESRKEQIFSFDMDEETLRHEPWTGSEDRIQENIKCFLNGETYRNPNNGSIYKNYSESPLKSGGFIAMYKDKKFVETIEEYKTNSQQRINTESTAQANIGSLTKEKFKRMIVFTLIE